MRSTPGDGSLNSRAAAASERTARLTGAVAANLAQAVEMSARLRQEPSAARSTITHLAAALESNRRIDMAIGIVMGQLAVTEEEAFGRLRTVSQSTNPKLRDIAEDVIYTGQLPLGAA